MLQDLPHPFLKLGIRPELLENRVAQLPTRFNVYLGKRAGLLRS
jgi:hypothetical protein